MTNPETQDEWITSETFGEFIEFAKTHFGVVRLYIKSGDEFLLCSHENVSDVSNDKWLCAHLEKDNVYALRNPNYVKQPKRGEIWLVESGRSGQCRAAVVNDKTLSVFYMDGNTPVNWINPTQEKFIEFTGQTTDLFDKLDALGAGGSNE